MVEVQPTIRNLKIGVTLPIRELKHTVLANTKLDLVNHSNYSVIRDTFVYIIFWSGNYVNITKIPSLASIIISVKHLQALLNIDNSEYQITVHNICASGKFLKQCNLKVLQNLLKVSNIDARVKLNQSVFPALYVKYLTGTCIIFRNGKYTVVGCNTENDITFIVNSICAYMKML